MEGATSKHDLMKLPSNHFEALGGNRISQILSGKRSITADTSLRLARWFGTSAEFWINLQKNYELRLAEQKEGLGIERTIIPRQETSVLGAYTQSALSTLD